MEGYNLPESTGPNDPEAPWCQPGEPVQDEKAIRQALEEVHELETSLLYLDRERLFNAVHNNIFPVKSLFVRSNPGVEPALNAYLALLQLKEKLTEMLKGKP